MSDKDEELSGRLDRILNPRRDVIVDAVCDDLQRRSQLGIMKYGTTLGAAVDKGSLLYWLQHAYEEALDNANYLKAAIVSIETGRPSASKSCYYPHCNCAFKTYPASDGPLPVTMCPRGVLGENGT